MKAITVSWIVLAMLFSTASIAVASDSIWVGNMQIGIGMEKNKVFSTLGENYDVSRDSIHTDDPTWENWSIYKKSEKRKAKDLVGMIAFKKDRVAWVGKPWGSFGGNEVAAFGKAFAGALSGLIEEGQVKASVRLRQHREPDISMESISLQFGNHDITLSITDQGIQIQENVSK